MIILVRFRAIQRLEHFSRTRTRSLICRCSRELSFLNFHTRTFAILFIWPNDTTRAISRNSHTPTVFTRAHLIVNLRLFRENYFWNFRTWSLAILFIWSNDTARAISRNSMTPTFFMRALALFNLRLLPRALFFKFLCANAFNIFYLGKWYYSCDFAQFWDSNIYRARIRAL